MKKQPERTAATRNALIDAFVKLNEHKPIEKITIQELTNIAGYNRTTFYQYFEDTFHLLACMEDDIIVYIQESIVTRIGNLPPEELFIELFTDMYHEKHKYLTVLFDSGNYIRFSEKLKRILIPAFANRLCLIENSEQTEYMLEFYLSGMISIIAKWINSSNGMLPDEFARLVRHIVGRMGFLVDTQGTIMHENCCP